MFLSNMSPKVMLFLWLLLYGSVSRGRGWTETCAGSLVCKITCKIVFSVCKGWKGARRCLQRAEVAGTGDSGHWKAVAEDGRDSSKPPPAPSSWSAPALQSVPGFPVHVEVSMSS